MSSFLKVFNNYRRIKKNTDMKIIKLISLFEDATKYPNRFEDLVVEATYEDVTALTLLYDICFDLVKPIKVYCPKCNEGVENNEELRGMEVGLETLTSNFFRDLLANNQVAK